MFAIILKHLSMYRPLETRTKKGGLGRLLSVADIDPVLDGFINQSEDWNSQKHAGNTRQTSANGDGKQNPESGEPRL